MNFPEQTSYEPSPEDNPLFRMLNGEHVENELPEHKLQAKVGNLYFEYVQNVAMFKGIVRTGAQVAQFLESMDYIKVNWRTQEYRWKREPLTKTQFARLFPKNIRLVNGLDS